MTRRTAGSPTTRAAKQSGQIARPNRFSGRLQFFDRPPLVLCHDLGFERGPAFAVNGLFGGVDDEESLLGEDLLAVGKLKHEFTLSNRSPGMSHVESGFFLELANGPSLKRLIRLEPATRRRPIISPGQRAIPVNEPEQQNSAGTVENEQT